MAEEMQDAVTRGAIGTQPPLICCRIALMVAA